MSRGSYQRRLRTVESKSSVVDTSFSDLSTAGSGHSDQSTGVHIVHDTFDFIWARVYVNESGEDTPDTCSTPYAWEQVVPVSGGCWEEPSGGMEGTTTLNPAFEENGLEIDSELIVRLRPGASYVDENGVFQQEWLFCSPVPATEKIALVRVKSSAIDVGGTKYYWSKINTFDPGVVHDPDDPGEWTDDLGAEVWLVQRFNYALTNGGCYIAKSTGKRKTLDYDSLQRTLPVYVTTEFPALGEDCEVLN